MSLKWYFNRLRIMSLPEMLWRLSQKLQVISDYLRRALTRHWKDNRLHASHFLGSPGWYSAGSVEQYPIHTMIFDVDIDPVGSINWHHDPYTGKTAPQTFSPLIDIRDTNTAGDIKYIWEINRHQYLSALSWSKQGIENPSQLMDTLLNWVDANPYLVGVNWTSSLELGLRMISWQFIFNSIRSEIETRPADFAILMKSAEQQLNYIAWHFSRYSSANNHLIGEAAGLYVGSTAFPWLPKAKQWRSRAKRNLEEEIKKQVTDDGINKEQSTSYQIFTLELFLIATAQANRAGDQFSSAFMTRLRAMLDYVDDIASVTGDLPNFGDSDDARGFKVSSNDTALSVVLDIGAVIFDEPRFLRFNGGPSQTLLILFGDEIRAKYKRLRTSGHKKMSRLYPSGGKALLRDSQGITIIADFGEHGYLGTAAHAHADALSFLLMLDDQYFLIDPGTYAYYSHQEWRDYFRSTAAHNTLRIDSLDQSVIGGRFLWSTQARSRLVEHRFGDTDMLLMEHDGYRRLGDPVLHRRQIFFDKRAGEVSIVDSVDCARRHLAEIHFHLHEQSQLLEAEEDRIAIRFGRYTINFIGHSDRFEFSVYTGSLAPITGWRAPSFHRKLPCLTLRYAGLIEGCSDIRTVISFKRES